MPSVDLTTIAPIGAGALRRIILIVLRPVVRRAPLRISNVRVENRSDIHDSRAVATLVATAISVLVRVRVLEEVLFLFDDLDQLEGIEELVFPLVRIVDDVEGPAIEVFNVEVRSARVDGSMAAAGLANAGSPGLDAFGLGSRAPSLQLLVDFGDELV